MLRIIRGFLRGKKILIPRDSCRPTRQFIRESIFNIIENNFKISSLFKIQGSFILDLFSGSGSFGLESISRGASFVIFIEDNPKSIITIKKNVQNFSLGASCLILNSNISRLSYSKLIKKIDLVFLDPPYEESQLFFNNSFLLTLLSKGWINHETIIVFEIPMTIKNPNKDFCSFKILTNKSFKTSNIFFLKSIKSNVD